MRKPNPFVTEARKGRVIVSEGQLSKHDRAALDYAAEIGLLVKWRGAPLLRRGRPFETRWGLRKP